MARDVIADLVAQVTLDGSKFDKGMGQVNRQLKTVQEELKTARSRFRQTGNETDFLGDKSQTLSGKLKLQQTRLDMLNKAYNKSKENSGEFSKSTQNLATKLERANREMQETESELKDVNRQLDGRKWTKVGESAETAGKKMKNAGQIASNFGRTYTMGVTLPIAAGAGAAFKASMDFESAFAGVEKTVDGSAEQIAELEKGIRDMAKEIPASTTEIAAIAEAAGQLGIETNSIEGFTRTMVDLGEATNMTGDEAATSFARFANIVGMSQEDFDRLGSTVVDLGNNLATTEGEITSMAMRIAGAGAQVGMTEADILSFSGALSSVGIEAEAGGSAFSKVIVGMASAAESGGEDLEAFAKVAGVSAKEFKKAYQEDATGAIVSFIEGLATAEDRGLSAIGILEEMGIKEVRLRDTLLRAAGASDVFSGALETGSKAWEENTALTEEAEKRYATTESQLKIMWNRVKDVAISLGDALVPAVMDTLDAAEPLIQKIEDGAEAFAEMSESEQQTILKMVGLAAALGPVSVGLGGAATAAGGAVTAFGGISKALGKAGGTGALGRIAGLGVAGPVGLAIAGVGALGLAVYSLKGEKESLNEISFETAEALKAEHESTGEMIKQFDKLRKSSTLTKDEFARYIDLQAELQEATDPGVIAAIEEEMKGLKKESGLSNKELDTMVGLNSDLVETLPGATGVITDQGQKVAGTTSELEKYNAEILKMSTLEMEKNFYEALENQSILLDNQIEQEQALERTRIRKQEVQKLLNGYTESELETYIQKVKEEKESLENQAASAALGSEERKILSEQAGDRRRIYNLIKDGKSGLTEQLIEINQQVTAQEEQLGNTKQQIKEFDVITQKLQEQYLTNGGISEEKARQAVEDGKQIKAIDTQIEKLRDAKTELKQNNDKGVIQTAEYEKGASKIDDQIDGLQNSKGKIGELIGLAGEYSDELASDVNKNVNLRTNPSLSQMNAAIAKKVTKKVQLSASDPGGVLSMPRRYASPADYHPGGLFIAGGAL